MEASTERRAVRDTRNRRESVKLLIKDREDGLEGTEEARDLAHSVQDYAIPPALNS